MEKKNEEELIDLDWFKDAAELVDLVQSRCWGLYAEKLKRIIAEAERRKEIEVLKDAQKLVCEVHDAITEKYASYPEMSNLRDDFIQSINSHLDSLK